MKHKTPPYIVLAILGVASVNVSHAAAVPSFPAFPIAGVPDTGYPSFINKALTVNLNLVTSGADTYYRLTANGSGTFIFNLPEKQYSGTSGRYSLVANFNQNGNMISSIGAASTPLNNNLTIRGALSASEAGSTPTWGAVSDATTVLWSAHLAAFGSDAAQDVLGFKTTAFGGWANAVAFTGGSAAESVYLYDALGLNGLTGALAPITDAFAAHDLSLAPLTPIAKVQSIATVPVPAAFVLFGSAMAMLAGFKRKS
jgi:hypothetical protein